MALTEVEANPSHGVAFEMMSVAKRLHPSISKTTEQIMPMCLINSALPGSSELSAAPSAVPRRPASEAVGQPPRAIIPGDDPGDQQPPKSTLLPSRLT
jgi:hypothetical protein